MGLGCTRTCRNLLAAVGAGAEEGDQSTAACRGPFHKQKGDITIGDRAIRIDKVEAVQRFLWYAIERPKENGGGYYYPFAAHPK